MKKVIRVLAVLFAFGVCFSPSAVLAEVHIYAYPNSLTAADQLRDGPNGNQLQVAEGTKLIWVDLAPRAYYAHPTLYILINGNNAKVVNGQWWPVLNGNKILHGSATPVVIQH